MHGCNCSAVQGRDRRVAGAWGYPQPRSWFRPSLKGLRWSVLEGTCCPLSSAKAQTCAHTASSPAPHDNFYTFFQIFNAQMCGCGCKLVLWFSFVSLMISMAEYLCVHGSHFSIYGEMSFECFAHSLSWTVLCMWLSNFSIYFGNGSFIRYMACRCFLAFRGLCAFSCFGCAYAVQRYLG